MGLISIFYISYIKRREEYKNSIRREGLYKEYSIGDIIPLKGDLYKEYIKKRYYTKKTLL